MNLTRLHTLLTLAILVTGLRTTCYAGDLSNEAHDAFARVTYRMHQVDRDLGSVEHDIAAEIDLFMQMEAAFETGRDPRMIERELIGAKNRLVDVRSDLDAVSTEMRSIETELVEIGRTAERLRDTKLAGKVRRARVHLQDCRDQAASYEAKINTLETLIDELLRRLFV